MRKCLKHVSNKTLLQRDTEKKTGDGRGFEKTKRGE